jgi:glyoxylase-like metal-dependent hydrolase (beta-lactamase superfamily II)
MKKKFLAAVGAVLCCVAFGAAAQQRQRQQPQPPPQQQQDFSKVEIHALKVRDNIYMLVGSGGNITVQIGDEGILLVDTQYAPLADRIIAAIREISDKPIHYIVDTHHHADHTGGNVALRLAGNTVSGGNMAGAIRDSGVGAAIIAHENVLNRLSTDKSPQALPSSGWPTSTYFGAKKELYFNNEGIEILHMPAAHTDGDSIVFFRRSDVISAGDVFVTTGYPFIDIASGGSYAGIVKALDRIEDIVIPVYGQDGGTLVIPGHGRLSNLGDVLNFREMIIVVRDRIQEMIKAGMTVEQVKAAKPTFDYDPVYGSTTGFITTDGFVEAAYQSLKNPPEDPQ